MRRFTRSKRRGGGIDPPTHDMTKDQLKSYITTYREEMLSAKEQKAKKEVLFQIAMDTYEAFRAVENKIAANTMAALAAGPGNHVTNRRKSVKKTNRNALLHLLNLPSASASSYNNTNRRKSVKKNSRNALRYLLNLPSASASSSSSYNNVNNLTQRFGKMSIHNADSK